MGGKITLNISIGREKLPKDIPGFSFLSLDYQLIIINSDLGIIEQQTTLVNELKKISQDFIQKAPRIEHIHFEMKTEN